MEKFVEKQVSPIYERGTVVKSIAGRDKDRLLVVAEVAQEYLLVIDGKERPVQRPKRKNPKHVIPEGEKFSEDLLRFNNPLRKALNKLAAVIKIQLMKGETPDV